MSALFQPNKNKKAVSEIVSYTLLIVIAVVASSLVYYFLQLQTPKDKTECKEGISMGIDYVKLNCPVNADRTLDLTLLNNGRYKINAAYIRIGEEGKSVKYWINDPAKDDAGEPITNDQTRDNKFYLSSSDSTLNSGLMPNKISLFVTHVIPKSNSKVPIPINNEYILEIEPAIISENTGKLAACENAIITRKIICATQP
ncbi:MAG: archaellin/type IV pilin N-terminal domain-containing protein [Nanoarchaeota archaeon]